MATKKAVEERTNYTWGTSAKIKAEMKKQAIDEGVELNKLLDKICIDYLKKHGKEL